MKKYINGADIAEIDFNLRGGGDFIGLRQSGRIINNKYIIPITRTLIEESKKLAETVVINQGNISLFESIKDSCREDLLRKVAMN